MKIGNINTSKKVFIIAEIGNNHEGSFEIAKKMINEAANTGVDAVKFQTFLPEHFISCEDQSRLNKLRSFKLSNMQFRKLSKIAKKKGLIFFSTPLDIHSAKFLNTIQPIFKIASGDNNFYPLIDAVIGFRKPLIISTGAAGIKDVQKIYAKIIKNNYFKKKGLHNLAFLHCVSSYPVPNNQANLGSITYLKRLFPNIVIGYSDHTKGVQAATLSVLAGARIVEKHFTLDKNFSNFRDHKLSADPKEMSTMVRKIRQFEKMLGKEDKTKQLCEKEMNIAGRRSIAVSRDMKKGIKLQKSDLIWVRPASGFSPGEEKKIIRKKILRDLKMGEIIKKRDIK